MVAQALVPAKIPNGHSNNQTKISTQPDPGQAGSSFMQKRYSNSGILNQKEESSGSRFAINYLGGSEEQNGSVTKALPNLKLNNSNDAYGQ